MAPLRTLELTDFSRSQDLGPLESSSPLRWPLALVALWAAGIVVLVGRSVWNYVRIVRQMPPLEDVEPEWADEWNSLQRQAGIRRLVPLAVAEHAGPVLFRLPRGYRLIVPASAWRSLEPSQRLAILRHELAHIQRRDVWKSLAARALALPHWFNPLAWLVVRRFDECAEWACDEAARRAAPEDVPDYARALLQLVQRAEPVFFATRAARAHGLSLRIRRLLTPSKEKGSSMKTAVMLVLVSGFSLVNLTRLQTRADEDSAKAAPAAAAAPASAPTSTDPTAPARAATAVIAPAPAGAVSIGTPADPAAPAVARSVSATPAASGAATPATIAGSPAVAATAIGPAALSPAVGAQAPAATLAPIGAPVSIGSPATAPAAALVEVAVDPANGGADPRAGAVGAPRPARADLGYILKHLNEFQHAQENVNAQVKEWERDRQRELAQIKAAQQRYEKETDPLLKDLLGKWLVEKITNRDDEHRNSPAKTIEGIQDGLRQRILDEIGKYAREQHLPFVRRSDYQSPAMAPVAVRPVQVGAADLVATPSAHPAGDPFVHSLSMVLQPVQVQPDRWNREVLYVAKDGDSSEVDISDAIVKRLNAAYAAQQKQTASTQTFSFDVGLTH